MDTRSRKALGCAVLLIYLSAYAAAAATLGAALLPMLPAWGEFAYYAVAGLIWIVPLKPLFAWLNRSG